MLFLLPVIIVLIVWIFPDFIKAVMEFFNIKGDSITVLFIICVILYLISKFV